MKRIALALALLILAGIGACRSEPTAPAAQAGPASFARDTVTTTTTTEGTSTQSDTTNRGGGAIGSGG